MEYLKQTMKIYLVHSS